MSLVKSGRYPAKVVSHAITETKGGDPQAAIRFGFETSDGPKELTFFGSFKGGALEHTLKALVASGLKGNNPAGPLEIGKDVSIVVEINKDINGNDRNVVRWVNQPGGVTNKMDDMSAKAKLEQYTGAVMALREKVNAPPSLNSDDDDLGF